MDYRAAQISIVMKTLLTVSAVGSECIARLNLRTVRHTTRPSSHRVIITEEKEDHSNRKRIRGRKCNIVARY